MIGYDGSESSDAVLEDLNRAGWPSDSEVVVASVADLLMSSPSAQHVVLEAVSSLRVAAVRDRGETHAESVIAEAEAFAALGKKSIQGLFPDWSVRAEILTGTPTWKLIDAAEKLNADMIMVGSQGRSAIGRCFWAVFRRG